jgi:iron complex outermembrane receptor protein
LATTVIGGLSGAILAGLPAIGWAQSAPPASNGQPAGCTTSDKSQPGKTCAPANGDATTSVGEIVVTGSRIREPSNYTSPDPIQVITGEQSTLQGLANTAQIIQQSTVAANSTQINNFFTGYVVNGGPGVNTVSLRGLGADRTLVLLDGQRMGPAGVSGTVGSVDLNTIPSTIIDHVDILKDGSSSIYGSDAVAGVVNIVTKQNFEGIDLHFYAKPSYGGEEYDMAGSWGMKFDRGYVNVSADYYQQEALTTGERSYLDCAQEFAYGANGQRLDLIDPRDAGHYKCYNLFVDAIEDANTGYAYIPADLAAPGAPTNADLPGLHRVGCLIRDLPTGAACSTNAAYPVDVSLTRLSAAEIPYTDPQLDNTDAISPVQRWTIVSNAAYDLIPDRVQLYNDFMFNRRVSSQDSFRQIFPYLEPGNPANIFNASTGDYELPIVLTPTFSHQTVDYLRDLFGVRGDLPNFATVTGVHYDLSAQFSHSSGTYGDTVFLDSRVNASVSPTGCDPGWSEDGGPTMLSLGDTTACVPVDWTAASFNGRFTPQELAFLQGYDVGHTLYTQEYGQGDIQADLVKLPAGPLGVDLGFMVRRDYINDVPGPIDLADNLWNSTSSGITRGSDAVREVFGEIAIPVLKDLPAIHSLDFRVSGRYSDYDSVGSAKTYKAEGRWAVTNWLAFKYVQGTSFRAPQLYELYLADQTSFLSQFSVDPCINYNLSGNPNLAKNCAAAGVPPNYAGLGSSAEVLTGGGLGNLKPETSLARTTSLVLTPHLFGIDAGFELDYYENHISNGIQQFGASNIVYACYDSNSYPNNGFCSLFTRDPTTLSITTIHDNYVNVASVLDRGIDATIYWNQHLPDDILLRVDSQLSWTLKETTQLLNSSTVINYNGTVGSPEFVGNVNIRLTRGIWTVNWFMNMVGHTSDAPLTQTSTPSFHGTGVTADFLLSTQFYTTQNLSVRRQFPHGLSIEAGILNLFDSTPPAYSVDGVESLIGQFPLTSQYDLVGRTAFFTIDKKF